MNGNSVLDNAGLAAAEADLAATAEGSLTIGGTPVNLAINFQVPQLPDGGNLSAVGQLLRAYAARAAEMALGAVLKQLEARRAAILAVPPEPPSVLWEPMRPAGNIRAQCEELSRKWGIPLERLLAEETWMNAAYVAKVVPLPDREGRPPMWHLSVRRFDRAAVRDWRDFQRIKNDVFGPEAEAAELYPAESRLCDTANQYHLWVVKEPFRFPFGYANREVATHDAGTGARQRDWHPAETPADAVPGGDTDPHQEYA